MSNKDEGKGKMLAFKSWPKKLLPTRRVDNSQQTPFSLPVVTLSPRVTPSPRIPTNTSNSQSTPSPLVPGVNSPNNQSVENLYKD